MKYFLSILLSVLLMANSTLTGYAQTLPTEENPGNGESTAVQLHDIDSADYRSPRMHLTSPDEDESLSLDGDYSQFADTDIVRVSILLDSPSTVEKGYSLKSVAKNRSAVSYRNSLKREQNNITKKIEKSLGKKIDVIWNITLLANLISAEVEFGDIEAIEKVDGVKKVILENRYQVEPVEETPDTFYTTEYMIFAVDAWNLGYTGAGSLVAIVDTGINHNHILFDAEAFEYSLEQSGKEVDLLEVSDISAVLDQLHAKERMPSATAEGLYKNSKIPYAFNYRNNNYNTDHQSARTDDHGSHVAGIAAGNRYIKVDGEFVESREAVKAVGVAPDAQLMAMQVFNSEGGTSDSDYMVAIEDAIVLGATSINLSLGMPYPGFTFNYTYQEFLDKVTEFGSLLVMSGGNAGSWNRASSTSNVPDGYLYIEDINWQMGGTPGIYANTISVASANNVGSNEHFVRVGEEAFKYTDSAGNTQVAGPRQSKVFTIAGAQDFVFIDGYGTPEEYAAVNAVEPLDGKVVIVRRGGDVSFYLKGNDALRYNPKGIFVVNYEGEAMNFYMNLKDNYDGSQPMILVPYDLSDTVRSTCEAKTAGDYTYYTGTIYISSENEKHDFIESVDNAEMSAFSSWGVPGSLTLKPEITAPGGNINSAAGLTTDQFQVYSGTSMAAPHTAGMAAILGQYVRENGLEQYTEGNPRKIINSLLMSTAFPMFSAQGTPYPVLQQGAGLADVYAATMAKTFIMMGADATASYADGKVKVELGDDPERSGKYTYTFDLTNISEEVAVYELFSMLFTQMPSMNDDGTLLVSADTYYLDITEKYTVDIDYDVNKDGVTDEKDAQAILDYITGVVTADDIDTDVADIDGNGKIQALDARKLLQILADAVSGVVAVKPGETVTVQVELELEDSENNAFFEEYFENGFYIEGYTFASPMSEDDATHSIPIIGYYGNYTDAPMFDKSVEQELYENKEPYMEYTTNYPAVKYPGDSSVSIFTGNPYVVEESGYPRDRLALSSDTLLKSLKYSLIRAAGSFAYEIYTIIGGEKATVASDWDYNIDAGFYYDQDENPRWMYNAPYDLNVNSLVKDFGVAEGDKLGIRIVALPEYYGMLLTDNAMGVIPDTDTILMVRDYGIAGKGSELGFEFTVDDTAPELISVVYDQDNQTVTVTAKDNEYIAAIALTDVAGIFTYAAVCPEQSEPGETVTATISLEGIEDNAVVVMVGDYAANETIKLAIIKDGPVTKRVPYYVLTNEFVPGNEYIIANRNTAGTAPVLVAGAAPAGSSLYYNTVGNVQIISDEKGTYIPYGSVDDSAVWVTEQYYGAQGPIEGYSYLVSKATGFYATTIAGSGQRTLTYTKEYGVPFWYTDNRMNCYVSTAQWATTYFDGKLIYERRASNYVAGRSDGVVYLYGLDYYLEEIENPQAATSIETTPESLQLILGAKPEADIIAKVYPEYIENTEVTWESADESIVTVDENGHVIAVAVGETSIRATSKATPEVYVDVPVKVVSASPVDYQIFGVATTADASYPIQIDLNDMSIAAAGVIDNANIVGGGRSGQFMFFSGVDEVFSKYDIYNDFAVVDSFDMIPDYLPMDVASLPVGMGTVEGELVPFDKYEMVAIGPDGAPMVMGDYQDETGEWQRIVDPYTGLNEYFGIGRLVAVAFLGAYDYGESGANTEFDYYAIDEFGHLIFFYLNTDEAGYLDNEANFYFPITLGDFGPIPNLTISDDLTAYSLTYRLVVEDQGTEDTTDDVSTEYLYLADATTNSIYEITITATDQTSKFVGVVDGVKRLSSLFNNGLDAVETYTFDRISNRIGDKEMGTFSKKSVPAAPASFAKPSVENASVEEPAAEPVEAEILPEEPSEEAPVLSAGGLGETVLARISTRGPIILKQADFAGAEGEDGYDVTYTETVDVGSGVVKVTYDPETTELLSVTTDLEFTSYKDDGEGTIIFSFANLEDIAAGETIAVFSFSRVCEDTTVDFEITERDGEEDLDDKTTVTIEGIGHDYQFDSFEWSEDLKSAKAVYICKNDSDHVVKYDAEVTEKVTTEPGCETPGVRTYTASYDGHTEDKTEEIEPIGHDYQFVEMVWSEDHAKATAKFVCANDESHVLEVEAEVTVETVDPTDDKEGSKTYTATATLDGETFTDTYTETIPVPTDPDVPGTGDNTGLGYWISGMGVSLGCLLAVLLALKKRKQYA